MKTRPLREQKNVCEYCGSIGKGVKTLRHRRTNKCINARRIKELKNGEGGGVSKNHPIPENSDTSNEELMALRLNEYKEKINKQIEQAEIFEQERKDEERRRLFQNSSKERRQGSPNVFPGIHRDLVRETATRWDQFDPDGVLQRMKDVQPYYDDMRKKVNDIMEIEDMKSRFDAFYDLSTSNQKTMGVVIPGYHGENHRLTTKLIQEGMENDDELNKYIQELAKEKNTETNPFKMNDVRKAKKLIKIKYNPPMPRAKELDKGVFVNSDKEKESDEELNLWEKSYNDALSGKGACFSCKKQLTEEERMEIAIKDIMRKLPGLTREQVIEEIRKIRGRGTLQKGMNKGIKFYNKKRGFENDPRNHILKDNEKHAIFKNKKGALVAGQFAGPGSDLVGNLKELLAKNDNDISKVTDPKNWVSPTDLLSLHHDIQYQINSADKDKIRKVDERYGEELDRYLRLGESKFNVLPSKLVNVKVKLEKAGVLNKGTFAVADENVSEDDMELLKMVSDEIEENFLFLTDEEIKKMMPQFGNGKRIIRRLIENCKC